MKYLLILSLISCSSYPCEDPDQPRADEMTCLPTDFEQTAAFWQAVVCTRQVWDNYDVPVHFVNDADWRMNDDWAGVRVHSGRNEGIFVRVFPTSNTYGLTWVLNHEFVHSAYGDNRHTGYIRWTQNSGEKSIQSTKFREIRACMEKHNVDL